MKALPLILVILGGCSAVPREELLWQAIHAVDVAQTIQIADSSCYQESDPITRNLIGENPSIEGALAWGVGLAVFHAGVTSWLQTTEAPRWLQVAWQGLTIANSSYVVKQNLDQGITPVGTGC